MRKCKFAGPGGHRQRLVKQRNRHTNIVTAQAVQSPPNSSALHAKAHVHSQKSNNSDSPHSCSCHNFAAAHMAVRLLEKSSTPAV